MTQPDLTRRPSGAMGWEALVEWAAATDDRAERYFLELKSDVDLNDKRGKHKVAKFVLGAANRDPSQAQRRFGGAALLMLGVKKGAAAGIPPFEAKDLAREVRKFTGADGPVWDFERIPVDDDHDVIVIVVEPPTGQIWPCLSDGIDMTDGDVYIRKDGETAKAGGDELRALLSRAVTPRGLPALTVAVAGEVNAIKVNEADINSWIEAQTSDYRSQTKSMTFGGFSSPGLISERRNESEFEQEVSNWRDKALADPTAGLHDLIGRISDGIAIELTNPVTRYLSGVRVDIELPEGVRALEYIEHVDGEPLGLFPDRPLNWGADSISRYLAYGAGSSAGRLWNPNGHIEFDDASPSRLTILIDELRPEGSFATIEHDVVLVSFVTEPPAKPTITASWRLTARDVHDVLVGELAIPVVFRDWTTTIREVFLDDGEVTAS